MSLGQVVVVSRARTLQFGVMALFGAFLAARIVILFNSVLFTSFDSASYAARPGAPASLVSFLGHAPRLWGVPLFYALFSTDTGRAYGQWAVGTIAWAGLAAVVFSLLRHPLARFAGAAVVLLIGLLPQ